MFRLISPPTVLHFLRHILHFHVDGDCFSHSLMADVDLFVTEGPRSFVSERPVFVSTVPKKTNKQLVTTNIVSNSLSCDCPVCEFMLPARSPGTVPHWITAPPVVSNLNFLPGPAYLQHQLLYEAKIKFVILPVHILLLRPTQTSRTLGQGLHCRQWRPCSRLRPLCPPDCCWQPSQQSGLQQRQDQSTATQR